MAFGYYGGKFSKLGWLLPQLETPHKTYCELFAGSLSVMLNKPPAEHEIVNDLSEEVTDFWLALREHKDELIQAIMSSPPGESEFKRCFNAPSTDDIVERARRFYVRVTQAYSNLPASKNHSRVHQFIGCRPTLSTIADRIRNVEVENTTATRLMRRLINRTVDGKRKTPILFYADPPYLRETRTTESGDYIHDDFNHDEFLDAVLNAPPFCKFAISGYPSPLYDNALANWHRVEVDVKLHASNNRRKGNPRRTEVVWRNYSIDSKQSRIEI